MVANLRQHHHTRALATPQSQPIPGRETEMVANNAGGFGFTLSDWDQLYRFLIIGTEGGTYYVGEAKLTKENALAAARCIQADGERVVRRVVEISDAGRAPKNDYAIFVLAMAAGTGDLATRRAALSALSKVCRTGTHLFQFAEFVEGFRGWGRALKRAVADWYNQMPVDKLALQAVKYRQRNGWSHRDLLRLAHPATDDAGRRALFDWICRGVQEVDCPYCKERIGIVSATCEDCCGSGTYRNTSGLPSIVAAFDDVNRMTTPGPVAAAIRTHNLPRETVPTDLLNSKEVWAALLERMPLTAMIRNLGKMTSIGLLAPMADTSSGVALALRDAEKLKQARVHPMALLLALKVYAQGRGDKGSLSWSPVPAIIDALDEAFYAAFQNVTPTGKRILVGVDVSGSMKQSCVGSGAIMCHEAAGAIATVFLGTEPNAHVVAFETQVHEPGLSKRQRRDDVMRTLAKYNGGTDLAVTIQYALAKGMVVDAFVLLTDNETWAGRQHPQQALEEYRRKVNPAAKLVCLSMAANHASVVDPKDPLSLGIAGFDAAAPQIVADFIAG